ncbi:MAG: hypothetical protein FJ090_17930 [Deltaproteobacteria bacterium]|nr:hypothetical protein [Deltaproteobacteria bacterium]
MNPQPRFVLISSTGDPEARALADELGLELRERAPLPARHLHFCCPADEIPARLGWARWLGPRLVWTPRSPPAAPGSWWSLVRRLAVASQEEARAWARLVPLGRIVVAPDAASLAAVYAEVGSVGARGLRATSGRSRGAPGAP